MVPLLECVTDFIENGTKLVVSVIAIPHHKRVKDLP
jgi:hypothetical protein